MSMPLSSSVGKLGPIEVSENDEHFLVRIHPENRERAKHIPGRQWDGERRAWVYAKNPATFDALVAEFQKDADIFDIRRPKTKRPVGIKPPIEEAEEDEFEEHLPEETRPLSDIDESQGKIQGELEQIRELLESLRDVSAKQDRTLEELRGAQTETVEPFPEQLDLSKQKEIELVEKALIMVACLAADESPSFVEWISKHSPLNRPTDFVNDTHELLKERLGKIAGDEDVRTPFRDLVRRIQTENLIYNDRHDPTQVIPTLKSMNGIRNRFAHARGEFSQWERWSRSLLYLINLAFVWSKLEM